MTRKIGFFVPPNVSLLGLDCALDTLRVANKYLDNPRYEWCTIGQDTAAVESSNGLKLTLDQTIDEDISGLDMLFVCSSTNPARYTNARVYAWLRRMSKQVELIGGITAGAFTLARAGLLDGYTCTVHWEDADEFRDEFPDMKVTDGIFVIDRDRMTSAGGLVTIDLFLQIVARDCGANTSLSMINLFQKERMRSETDSQSWSLIRNSRARPRQILLAANIMEQNIESPVSIDQIADKIGVSARHLHRVFLRHLQKSPSEYYRDVRLKKARRMLGATNLSVLEVSLACGFNSQSAFSRSYFSHFGVTPTGDRTQLMNRHTKLPS